MADRCFVRAVAQVSCQTPLTDDWMVAPQFFEQDYVRSQEPDTKGIISPGEARRMGKILKRAICTSDAVLKKSGIGMPDAIITGTAMGCMENSEKFLEDLAEFGENCLKPSLFMQSTHNTISSLIAISLKCHGYNNTYSHKGLSFESGLLDAWLQIRSDMIRNALVGAHDEVTPLMSKILRTTHPEYAFITETSVSAILSNSDENALCEVEKIELHHNADLKILLDFIQETSPQCVVTGINGNERNDRHYKEILESLGKEAHKNMEIVKFKNVFGDNFSSSAFGFYVGVKILEKGKVPEFLEFNDSVRKEKDLNRLLVLNHTEGRSWGLVSLKKV